MLPSSYRIGRAALAGLILGVTWAMLETQERRAKARKVYDQIMAAPSVRTGDE